MAETTMELDFDDAPSPTAATVETVTRATEVVLEEDGQPVLLKLPRAAMRDVLGIDVMVDAKEGQLIRDGQGRVLVREVNVRVLITRQYPEEPAKLTGPVEVPVSAPKPPHTRAAESVPFPVKNCTEPTPASTSPKPPPPAIEPEPDDLGNIRTGRNTWRPDWRFQFGKFNGLTLGQVSAKYGHRGLVECYWRGLDMIKTHSDTSNPNRRADYLTINRTMNEHIVRILFKDYGISQDNIPAKPVKTRSKARR